MVSKSQDGKEILAHREYEENPADVEAEPIFIDLHSCCIIPLITFCRASFDWATTRE
jgi:hypothetical protein